MPEQRTEKMSVSASSNEIAIADAIAFILGSNRSEVVRSGFLNFWKPGGTEYHIQPGSQPALTPEIISVLEDINQHDNDLAVKLRLKLGINPKFAYVTSGKESLAEMLANMKQNVHKGMKARQE